MYALIGINLFISNLMNVTQEKNLSSKMEIIIW